MTSQSPGLPEALATAYNPGMCLLALTVIDRPETVPLKRAGRACFHTVAAADTFQIVGRFPDTDIHAACFLAFSAFDAGIFPHLIAIECDRVEKAVHCAQRTDVFAEWAIYKYR